MGCAFSKNAVHALSAEDLASANVKRDNLMDLDDIHNRYVKGPILGR